MKKNLLAGLYMTGTLCLFTTPLSADTVHETQQAYHSETSNIFEVKQPDFKKSPYTGLTRKHWLEAAKYILNGAFSYIHCLDDQMYFPKQLDKTYPRDEKAAPVAKLEGLARTLFVAAPILHNDSNLVLHNIRVADYYRHQLISLSDPDSKSFIPDRTGGPSQTLLELGSLAISMKAAPEVLWNPLSKVQKDALAAKLKSYGEGPTIGSNWMFFNVFILSFLKDQGYTVNESYLEENLQKLLKRYRGEGWYNDAPAYDYYSAWAYQTYGPIWVHFFGKQYPQYAAQFLKNEHDMVDNYPYMFSKDGKMNMWGRSIPYRFASVSPFPWLEYDNSGKVNYGWIRRIASSTLLQFIEHPDFLENGVPTMGFYGEFAPAVQIYSCRGSVYWCGKAFFSLLLPENSKYWSAVENNGPWEKDLKKGQVYNKFQPATNLLITDYPNSGAAEMRSWCHETVAKDWQKFRSSENYNKLAYNTEFPWMADGKDGEISMNYGIKNKKGEWEVLRLYTFKSFENGIYRRDAILETDSAVKYQLADITLPDGILRVDKVTVPRPTTIRLGHYSLPQSDKKINVAFKEEYHGKRPIQWAIASNGYYSLAQIPLAGWEKGAANAKLVKGLNPVSKECELTYSENHIEGSKIYVTLQLWKKGSEAFTEKELTPVKDIKISKDLKKVVVTLMNGGKKTILFN